MTRAVGPLIELLASVLAQSARYGRAAVNAPGAPKKPASTVPVPAAAKAAQPAECAYTFSVFNFLRRPQVTVKFMTAAERQTARTFIVKNPFKECTEITALSIQNGHKNCNHLVEFKQDFFVNEDSLRLLTATNSRWKARLYMVDRTYYN
jgi:hypothetical protein